MIDEKKLLEMKGHQMFDEEKLLKLISAMRAAVFTAPEDVDDRDDHVVPEDRDGMDYRDDQEDLAQVIAGVTKALLNGLGDGADDFLEHAVEIFIARFCEHYSISEILADRSGFEKALNAGIYASFIGVTVPHVQIGGANLQFDIGVEDDSLLPPANVPKTSTSWR